MGDEFAEQLTNVCAALRLQNQQGLPLFSVEGMRLCARMDEFLREERRSSSFISEELSAQIALNDQLTSFLDSIRNQVERNSEDNLHNEMDRMREEIELRISLSSQLEELEMQKKRLHAEITEEELQGLDWYLKKAAEECQILDIANLGLKRLCDKLTKQIEKKQSSCLGEKSQLEILSRFSEECLRVSCIISQIQQNSYVLPSTKQ